MGAPVWDRIELDAVGELHLVLLLEPPALLVPFGRSSGFPILAVAPGLYVGVVLEFVLLLKLLPGPTLCCCTPSSFLGSRGLSASGWWTCVAERGGTPEWRVGWYGERLGQPRVPCKACSGYCGGRRRSRRGQPR